MCLYCVNKCLCKLLSINLVSIHGQTSNYLTKKLTKIWKTKKLFFGPKYKILPLPHFPCSILKVIGTIRRARRRATILVAIMGFPLAKVYLKKAKSWSKTKFFFGSKQKILPLPYFPRSFLKVIYTIRRARRRATILVAIMGFPLAKVCLKNDNFSSTKKNFFPDQNRKLNFYPICRAHHLRVIYTIRRARRRATILGAIMRSPLCESIPQKWQSLPYLRRSHTKNYRFWP